MALEMAKALTNFKWKLLTIGAVALLAAAFLWFTRSPAAPSGPLEALTIATNTVYAGSCPIFVAQDKGYFAREGLLVTVQPHTSGKAALEATLQGKSQLGTSADIPIMFAATKGQPVAVVATIFSTQSDYAVLGRKDRGIATPTDLRGKRIGVTLGTSGHFVLDAFLNRQKLSMKDVTVLDLKPEDLASALAKGDIDAAATWEPYAGAIKEQLRANGAVFSANSVYDATYNVSGTHDFVAAHPDTVKKVLRAMIGAARFCKDEPDAAREVTAKVMQTSAAKLAEFWPSYRFDMALNQSLVLALEDETRWAVKNNLADRGNMPNYLSYIDLTGLLAVMPAAVTVIH